MLKKGDICAFIAILQKWSNYNWMYSFSRTTKYYRITQLKLERKVTRQHNMREEREKLFKWSKKWLNKNIYCVTEMEIFNEKCNKSFMTLYVLLRQKQMR